MHINRPLQILFTFLTVMFIRGESSEAQWNLEKTDGNFRVYLHENWKSNHTYKAEGLYNDSMDNLYSFLLNFRNYPHWINYCSGVELLYAKRDSLYIYYSYYDLPWPLADREAISELRITQLSDSVIHVISLPSDTNFRSDEKALRVTQYFESFTIKAISEEKVLFRMQGSYDPGGYIPNWVVKKFLTEGPYDILLNIKEALIGGE